MQKQNTVTLALRCKWAMGRAPGYCSNDVVLSQVNVTMLETTGICAVRLFEYQHDSIIEVRKLKQMLTMGLPVIKPKKATEQTLNFAEETFCPNPHTEGSQIDTSYKYIKS